MKNLLKIAAVSLALTVTGAANAATIVVITSGSAPSFANNVSTANVPVDAFVTATDVLGVGDTAEFTFTALDRLRVSTISIAASDAQNGTDLASLQFGLSNPPTSSLSSITTQGGTANGTAFLSGLDLMAGESFTIFWDVANTGPVGISASFFTTAVPVPAALPLLIGGIAALGVASRKKKHS